MRRNQSITMERHSKRKRILGGFPKTHMKPYAPYKDFKNERLKDPQAAAGYLNAALEEQDVELFLLALADVARAHGMSALANRADLHRVSLHKMLSKHGNPEFKSIWQVIEASGLQWNFSPKSLPKAA